MITAISCTHVPNPPRPRRRILKNVPSTHTARNLCLQRQGRRLDHHPQPSLEHLTLLAPLSVTCLRWLLLISLQFSLRRFGSQLAAFTIQLEEATACFLNVAGYDPTEEFEQLGHSDEAQEDDCCSTRWDIEARGTFGICLPSVLGCNDWFAGCRGCASICEEVSAEG